MERKKTVMSFNHISKKLSDLYMYYHKLATCYRWKYKSLRIGISLNMTGIGLTVAGVIVGGVTLNPVILGFLTGAGVLIQGYLTKSGISNKTEKCKFAYTSYDKTLIQLQSFLRGIPFDEVVFLSNMKVVEDIVIDSCPPVDKQMKRNDKKFKIKKNMCNKR